MTWNNPQEGDELTPTEVYLLNELVKEGESYKELAYRTGKRWATVKSHCHSACLKLGVHNRVALILKWARREQEQDMKFVDYLENTLIRDLKDTGLHATAGDFEECVHIIRRLYGQG